MNKKEIMTVKHPAFSTIYEKANKSNNSALIRIVTSILIFIERAGAGQWRL